MIISNSNKFIFVHIPKCGGISVTDAFVNTVKWNDLILHGGKPEYGAELEGYFDRNFQLHGHQSANIIRKTVGIKTWDSYSSFSFVRNPYSRVVSLYTWVSKTINNCDERDWKKQNWYKWPLFHAYLTTDSFSEFIRSHFYEQAPLTKDQFSWVCDENRENIIVDFIGKTESLNKDLNKVIKELQIPDVHLEELNVSSRKNYREYYSCEDDIEFVHNKYEVDFDKFGYDRELSPK